MIGNMNKPRAVVTGADGFIGRPLVKALVRRGYEVLGIDLKGDLSAKKISKGAGAYLHFTGPMSEALSAVESFTVHVPEKQRIFFHLAGLSDAKICQKNIDLSYKLNVDLTFEALECCRRIGGAVFVFPSTGLVYRDNLHRPALEEDEVYSRNVYVATKLMAESLVSIYTPKFISASIIARLGNVYGLNAKKNTVIGKIFDQAEKGIAIKVFEENHIRDFIYIDDLVEGLIRLSQAAPKGECIKINLATGIGTSVGEVIDIVSEIYNLGRNRPRNRGPANISQSELVLSIEKLIRLTGWKPEITVAEGLKLIKAKSE